MVAKVDGSISIDFSTTNQAPLHEDVWGRVDTGTSSSPLKVYKATFKDEGRYK